MAIKKFITLACTIVLTSNCYADTFLDMKEDWLSSSDINEQVKHWLTSKNAKLDETPYGQSYLLKIPYYEKFGLLDTKKEHPEPYSSELSYGEKTFEKLCKKLGGTPIRAIQPNKSEPVFTAYDPSSERISQRHYPGCRDRIGNVSALLFEPIKLAETLRITLYSNIDVERYNEAKKQQESSYREASQTRYIEAKKQQQELIAQFRKNIKIGDYSSLGLIVEVKPPLAQVQTQDNVKWVRIDELMPPK